MKILDLLVNPYLFGLGNFRIDMGWQVNPKFSYLSLLEANLISISAVFWNFNKNHILCIDGVFHVNESHSTNYKYKKYWNDETVKVLKN